MNSIPAQTEAVQPHSTADSNRACPLWLIRLFPFIRWRHRVNPQTLRADFIAGLTGAIVVLPQGVAFASIAGMPPEYGLYAGIVPAIVAALWGSSWHLVSGPTTAASIVVFSSLSVFAEPATAEYVSLALTLTLMVGVLQITMGVARLGTLINYISHSVVVGFTAGAALLIASKQIKH
ncbi:MAG TPA: SulP family inorganic anion transporter, partial [Thiohalobacter sp.]|nr:SulP family inorganic anion transporter [Thiohalobacter sp.]